VKELFDLTHGKNSFTTCDWCSAWKNVEKAVGTTWRIKYVGGGGMRMLSMAWTTPFDVKISKNTGRA